MSPSAMSSALSMGPGLQPPWGTLPQYIAGMTRATPHLPVLRDAGGRQAACSLALLLCLGLPMAVLTACSRPEPGAAAASAPAPRQAPAQASSGVVAVAAPSPAALSEPAAAPAATAASASTGADPAAAKPAAALPPAVIAFQQQRDACDHFRGEEPYDRQRAAFLKAQLAKTCQGSDKALAALRKRFARDPQASAALRDYDDRIE